MKKYIPVLVVMVLTFALCFGVDLLCKRLRRNRPPRNQVKPQRKTMAFGIGLSFLGLAIGLNFWSQSTLIAACCVVIFLMGIGLMFIYLTTSIVYDEEGFESKAPFRKTRRFRYGEIRGELALLARSGANAMLYVGEEEVQLYQSMVGVNDFLQTAYHGWLKQTGRTEEEFPPPNPMYLVWFPEPSENPKGASHESEH